MASRSLSWFPLRVTYSRELAFQQFLQTEGVESFIPMRVEERMVHGKLKRVQVPAVHNLIFVHASRAYLDELKRDETACHPIRYIMDRETNRPIVVPDVQMRNFIAVAGTPGEQQIYLTPTEVALKKGDRVRINGGIWAGVEGIFLRIKGDRRVVVSIQGIVAVATAFVHPSLVDRLPDDTGAKPGV